MQIESYPGGSLNDPSNSLVNDLVDMVEVLHVLGLLLVGKHSKLVQKELADLHLILKLSNLFDSFIWRDPMEDGKEPASLVTIQDANVLQKLLLRSSSCILCTASVTIVTTSISSCHVVNGMSWEGSFLHQLQLQLQPQPQPQ